MNNEKRFLRFYFDPEKERRYADVEKNVLPRGENFTDLSVTMPLQIKCLDTEMGIYGFSGKDIDLIEYGIRKVELF